MNNNNGHQFVTVLKPRKLAKGEEPMGLGTSLCLVVLILCVVLSAF